MKTLTVTAIAVLCIGGAIALYFGGFFVQRDASTRSRNIETQVFHNSQAYVDGKVMTLDKMRSEYNAASAGDRTIIAAQVRREAATLDLTLIPADLRSFVESVR